ncbi:MAG: twin-arginine translocation signal domain-containing protein, partial [Verrucomicrobia bacterium]|nr:twin-arginine translocation signal domain-containing protein [Verrucomicrobiota bacterium]
MNRRNFLKAAVLGIGGLSLGPTSSPGAESADIATVPARSPTMHLGLVTYNLAADWDIATLIRNCESAKFEGVELRTTHAHKVEVNLSKDERK